MDKETRSIGSGKWCCVLLGVILIITTIGPGVCAQEQLKWTGNVNALIGWKFLDKDEWEPTEQLFELGLQIDFRPVEWPVNLAVDFSHSWDEEDEYVVIYDPILGYLGMNINLEARTTEVNLGVRYIYEKLPYIRPFIGGGPALVWADAEGSALGISVSDDDFAFGLWACGGAYVTLAEHYNLGAQVRYSWAEVELFDVDVDAGGWHVGVLFGIHW